MSQKKDEEKATLLQWKYDDAIFGICLKYKKQYMHTELLDGEEEMEEAEKKLRRWKKEENVKMVVKDCELPVGIDAYVRRRRKETKCNISPEYFNEFIKMIRSAAVGKPRKAIIKLTSAVLSSYLIRSLFASELVLDLIPVDEEARRAMSVTVSHSESVYHVLREIGAAMIVSTAAAGKTGKLKLNVPTVIPSSGTRTIKGTAWLGVRGCKNYKWLAPYRDTAVILDMRRLSKGGFEEFRRIDPWCTCITYGKKMTAGFGYQINIRGKDLEDILVDWESEKIHTLISEYLIYIWGLFRRGEETALQTLWNRSGKCIASVGKLKVAEKFSSRLMLFSMISFLAFIEKNHIAPEEVIEEFRYEALNALLPGCYPKLAESSVPEKTVQQSIEDALSQMLAPKNQERFRVVYPNEYFVETDPDDPRVSYWGYIRRFGKGKKKFAAVQFRKSDLEERLPEFGVSGDVAEELKAFCKLGLDYHHGAHKARMPKDEDDTNGVEALIFHIEKMTFLPEERRKYLCDLLENESIKIE